MKNKSTEHLLSWIELQCYDTLCSTSELPMTSVELFREDNYEISSISSINADDFEEDKYAVNMEHRQATNKLSKRKNRVILETSVTTSENTTQDNSSSFLCEVDANKAISLEKNRTSSSNAEVVSSRCSKFNKESPSSSKPASILCSRKSQGPNEAQSLREFQKKIRGRNNYSNERFQKQHQSRRNSTSRWFTGINNLIPSFSRKHRQRLPSPSKSHQDTSLSQIKSRCNLDPRSLTVNVFESRGAPPTSQNMETKTPSNKSKFNEYEMPPPPPPPPTHHKQCECHNIIGRTITRGLSNVSALSTDTCSGRKKTERNDGNNDVKTDFETFIDTSTDQYMSGLIEEERSMEEPSTSALDIGSMNFSLFDYDEEEDDSEYIDDTADFTDEARDVVMTSSRDFTSSTRE